MSLGKVYYDPKHPAGFGTVATLVEEFKMKKRDVEEWLSVITRTLYTNPFVR
jgi:peptidyl-tRNA hydrolase